MSKSKAQRFAQNRNSAGGCLKGVIKNLKHTVRESCTLQEREELDVAIEILDNVYEGWSINYENAKKELM